MSNTIQASVVSFIEHAADLDTAVTEQAAIDRATSVFTEFADYRWYYHDATVADRDAGPAVVSLATEAGGECVEARLEETATYRVAHFTDPGSQPRSHTDESVPLRVSQSKRSRRNHGTPAAVLE